MIGIAAAVPVAIGVKKGVEPVVKELKELLTGDIVTIEGQLFREVTAKFKGGKKSTRLVPINYMFRINALSILLAVGGAGLTAMLIGFGLWWSQLRVRRLTKKERVVLENEIAEGSAFVGLSGALFQTADAITRLQRGEELPFGLITAMQILIRTRNIDPLGTVTMKNLVALRKNLEKRIAAIRRALKANIKLDERKGFKFGPEEVVVSLIGG